MGALSRISGVSGFFCQQEGRRYAAARVGEAIDDGKEKGAKGRPASGIDSQILLSK